MPSWDRVPERDVNADFQRVAEILGRHGLAAVVSALQVDPRTAAELHAALPRLSAPDLDALLRLLIAENLVVSVGATGPRAYRVTARGRALGVVIEAIVTWATRPMPAEDAAQGHIVH